MSYKLSIRSAENFHREDPRWGNTTAAERIVLAHWHMETDGFNVEPPKTVSKQATAYAYVDAGRWVVRCPWCPSAQNASREDHRFFCVECGSVAVGGQWIEVQWPNEWREIELILERRPSANNQWWKPGETLGMLQAENDFYMKGKVQ